MGTGPPLDVVALDQARGLLAPDLPRGEVEAAAAWGERFDLNALDKPERTALHRFLAQAAELLGDRATAIGHWDEAVRCAPDDLRSRERLAATLHADGQLERAAAELRTALEPGAPGGDELDTARMRLMLGRILLARGEAAEARAVLEAAARPNAELNAALEVDLARCALALQDPEQALAHAASATRAATDDPLLQEVRVEAEVARAEALAALGRATDAAEAAAVALRLTPTHPVAMVVRAEALLESGEDREAAQHLLQLYLRQRPDDAHGHRLLIRALREGGQPPEQLAAALAAYVPVAPDAERSGVLTELARTRLLEGKTEEAARLLGESAEADERQKDGRWWLARAAVSAQIGDVDDARRARGLAAVADEDDARLLRIYAEGMSRRDEYAAAEEAWRELETRSPSDGEVQLGYAHALRDAGDMHAALEHADGAANLADDWGTQGDALELRAELLAATKASDTDRAEALYQAGCRRVWQGDDSREDAFRLLTEAHRLRRDHAGTCQQLADLELFASVTPEPPYADREHVSRGIEWWERGAALETPGSGMAGGFVTRAWLEHQRSRLPEESPQLSFWRAIVFLERSLVAQGPPSRDSLVLLATSHRSLANELVALQTLDQAAGAGADDDDDDEMLEERAVALANAGRFTDAEAELKRRRATEETPWSSATLAWLRQRSGRHAEALELLSGLKEAEPDNYWYRVMLADTLRHLGRTDAAVGEYRTIWADGQKDVGDEWRSKIARAGYVLFVLGAALPATLAEATSTFAELSEGVEPRIHEGLDHLQHLGLCRLAGGDLGGGVACLERTMAACRFPHEIEDVVEELSDLRSGIGDWARDEALVAAVERLERRATERKTKLEGSPVTLDDELERTLRAVPDPSDWPAVGAVASMARVEAARGNWSAAASRYRTLVGDAADRFPEAVHAFVLLADSMRAAGDEAMSAGDPEVALRHYEEALAIAADASGGHVLDDRRAGDLHARGAFARLELDRDPTRHLAEAVRRFAALQDVDDSHAEAGIVGAALVRDPSHYWSLDERWSRLPAPDGAPDAIAHLRTGLRSFLDRHFRLAEDDHSSRLPVVTPIVLEIGDALVAADTSDEWVLFKHYIPNMRAAIMRDLGVRLPGVRVRGAPALDAGGYVAMIDEATVARGVVPLDRRWTGVGRDELVERGIADDDIEEARDPRTGEPGAWLPPRTWEAAERAGLEVEDDPLEFVIHRLEALLRANVAEFVGQQEVEELLEGWQVQDGCAELIEHTLPDLEARSRFGRVLQALLADGLPLTAPREILEVVRDVGLGDGAAPRLVRDLRRALRERLPGNEPWRRRRELPPALAEPLRSGPVLSIRPDLAQALVAAVAEWSDEPGAPPALVTDPELRPLLGQLLAGSVPAVPVIASDELLATANPSPYAAGGGQS